LAILELDISALFCVILRFDCGLHVRSSFLMRAMLCRAVCRDDVHPYEQSDFPLEPIGAAIVSIDPDFLLGSRESELSNFSSRTHAGINTSPRKSAILSSLPRSKNVLSHNV
jgi:hypothetical protein